MNDKIGEYFSKLIIIMLLFLCLWNIYTVIFHGYVTNWFWETYYEEEPFTFIIDSIEVLWIPLLISILPIVDYFSHRIAINSIGINRTSKINQAKRLRRKKRKNKRKV